MAGSPGSMTPLGRVWALLSVVAAAACSVGYLLPFWLLGEQMGSEVSFGTFKRCAYPALAPAADGRLRVAMMNQCGRYQSWAAVPSPAWRGAAVAGALGSALAVAGAVPLALSCCLRPLAIGATPRIASALHFTAASFRGCLLVCTGVLLGGACASYPLGWGALEVKQACGGTSDRFEPGGCRLGWSFYCACAGAGLALLVGACLPTCSRCGGAAASPASRDRHKGHVTEC